MKNIFSVIIMFSLYNLVQAEVVTNTLNIDSYTLTLNQISTSTTATTTTQIQTLITDHLNSIEKVLDFNSGDVISTSTYTSFGTQVKEGNTNSNRGYTNQQSDQDSTGLNYYNARYQNPSYAQFISPDEATKAIGDDTNLKEITNLDTQSYLQDPQGLNSYSYVKNNPIMYSDPDGRWAFLALLATPEALAGMSAISVTLPYLAMSVSDSNEVMFNPDSSYLDKGLALPGYFPVVGSLGLAGKVANIGRYGDDAVRVGRGLKEGISSVKLGNVINSLYKVGDNLPLGTFGAALKEGLNPGLKIGGKVHSIKLDNISKALDNVLKEKNLNKNDINVVNLLKDKVKAVNNIINKNN